MNESSLIEELSRFANGNTLVLLYFVVVVSRSILLPLVSAGKEIRDFLVAATRAMNCYASCHDAREKEKAPTR